MSHIDECVSTRHRERRVTDRRSQHSVEQHATGLVSPCPVNGVRTPTEPDARPPPAQPRRPAGRTWSRSQTSRDISMFGTKPRANTTSTSPDPRTSYATRTSPELMAYRTSGISVRVISPPSRHAAPAHFAVLACEAHPEASQTRPDNVTHEGGFRGAGQSIAIPGEQACTTCHCARGRDTPQPAPAAP